MVRVASLPFASNVPGCGKKHFTFLLTRFRISSARAFMRDLYTRFFEGGADGWERKGKGGKEHFFERLSVP